MDDKTKVQCGLVEEVAPETGVVGNNSTPGTDDGLCDTAVDRAANPAACGEPLPGYMQDWSCDAGNNGIPVCEGNVPGYVGGYQTPQEYLDGEEGASHLDGEPIPWE